MRLINTSSLELEFFFIPPPSYAVLSHRWQEEEVTFQDMTTDKARQMRGFAKIENSAFHAREEGFEYIWVDTCCIDKTSSAELSEAINSMFEWYQLSSKCFVFLSDVEDLAEFEASQWFTRGWTLQELLAPRHVDFVNKNWQFLGSKSTLKSRIQAITRISEQVLTDWDLSRVPACQKMSWAANRMTTKAEDMAYCLMGLFNVNMPLLYGEGEEKAFLRLQEHFLKGSDDESIFAWNVDAETAKSKPYWGLLATTPKHFANAYNYSIPRFKAYREGNPTELTNNGLRISLVVQPLSKDNVESFYLAGLNCSRSPDQSDDVTTSFTITLQRVSDIEMQYARVRPDVILPIEDDGSEESKLLEGITRENDQISRVYVRATPQASDSVAGFCFNGMLRIDFNWKVGSAKGPVDVPAYVEAAFDGYKKDGTGARYSLLDITTAESRAGKGAFDVAKLKGRKVVGVWQLDIRSRQEDGRPDSHNEIVPFKKPPTPYLVVGLESLPENLIGTPSGYVRPWYTFSESPKREYLDKFESGEEELKLKQLSTGPCWLNVSFVPATYRFRTYYEVVMSKVANE